MDLLVRVHVESPLDEGEGHLQGFHPELRTVLRDELQSLDAHQAAVAGGVLLQILPAQEQHGGRERERDEESRLTENFKSSAKTREV